MSEAYGKFYTKTFTGSMRGAGAHVIAVMAYCVAHAQPPDGELEINPELIAFLIGEEVDKIQQAIDYLMAEDSRSRSPGENGRRLIKLGQFKYRLVNWLTHREGADDPARRAYWASKQAEHRAGRKESAGRDGERASFHPPTRDELDLQAAKIGLPEEQVDSFVNYYESNGWKVGRNKMRNWIAALSNWKVRYEERNHQHGTINSSPKVNPNWTEDQRIRADNL